MNLDEYAATNTRRGGRSCSVCELPAETRSLIDSKRGVYTARTIAAWLSEEKGSPTKKSTVERHMREHVK